MRRFASFIAVQRNSSQVAVPRTKIVAKEKMRPNYSKVVQRSFYSGVATIGLRSSSPSPCGDGDGNFCNSSVKICCEDVSLHCTIFAQYPSVELGSNRGEIGVLHQDITIR